MAIVWDSTPAYRIIDGLRHEFRVGVELTQSPATVTASTTSVTVTARRYLQTRYAVYDNTNTVSWSGSWSGSTSFDFSTTDTSGWSKSNIRAIGSPLTRTVTPSYTSTITTSITLSMSGIDRIPGTSSVTASITTAKRPVSAPAAVTGASVSRSSDTRHTLAWTLPAADPGRQVTSMLIRRREVGAASWTTIATLGAVSSYTDSSTAAGRRYEWQVLTKNSAGTSAAAYAGSLYTTPSAPTGVKAVRMGSDVVVSWTKSASPHTRSKLAWRQEGGPWQYPGWTSTGTSYVIKSPDPSLPLQYAVLAEAVNPSGTLTSSWAHSNWVQLLAPPAAPSALAPTAAEAGRPMTLTWQHNTTDTTEQSAYELRWRPRGSQDAWSGVPKTAGASSSHVVLAGLWPAGTEMEWQARTWGQHADPSAWSALAVTAVTEQPSVTLVEPAGPEHLGSRVTVRWDFFDPEGSAQKARQVTLYAEDGTTVLWRSTQVTTSRGVDVPVVLQDGMSYVVGVQASDAWGLWSEEVTQRLDVAYAPPPKAVVTPVWDVDSGTVTVQITHPAPTATEAPAVSCDLLRVTGDGEWSRIAADLALDTAVVDQIPAIAGPTHYRVVTSSALPSSVESATATVVPDAEGWIYLNTGAGWSRVVRVRHAASLTPEWGRPTAYHHMAHGGLPLSVRTEAMTDTVSVKVDLAPSTGGGATFAELRHFLATSDEVIAYRDPKGRRWFGDIHGLSGTEEAHEEQATFTFTRTDFEEDV